MRTLSSACRKPWSPCGGMKRVYPFGTRFQEEHAMVGKRHVAQHRHVAAADQPCIQDGMMGVRHGWVVTNAVRAPVRPATRWTLVVSMASATLISGKVAVRQRASLDVPTPDRREGGSYLPNDRRPAFAIELGVGGACRGHNGGSGASVGCHTRGKIWSPRECQLRSVDSA
jgi:hypothetical protein